MKRGFSLIEMLVAITITAIILAITTTQLFMQRKHINMQQNQIQLDRNTRLALVFIGNEMRELGIDPKKTHAFGIVSGNTSSIQYLSDKNRNGFVDLGEAGDIHINGNVLTYNNDSIIPDVDSLIITYLDRNNKSIAGGFTENDGTGFYTDTVALFDVHLITERYDVRGKLLARSDQSAQFERKN